jgi:redox-regulated HSP33 family molecular chaperone
MSAKLTKEEAELTEVARNYMERCEQLETELVALRARAEAAEGLREALERARESLVWHIASFEKQDFDKLVKQFDKYPNSKPRIIEAIDAALTAYDRSKGG